MNWYKKAQTGEWWIIDGSAVFADGDVGDMNHEAYVIESIKRKYAYDEFDKGEYIEWDEFKKELALEAFEEEFGKRPTEQYYQKYKDKMEDLYLKKLKEMGMTDEEYALAEGIGDAREYGLKNLGWKRVKQNNIQTNTLTVDDLKEIANGLYDINDALDENSDVEFNIEMVSTGAFYTDVPFKLISDGAPSQLRQYQSVYAKNNSWYRFAQSAYSTFWMLPDGEIINTSDTAHDTFLCKNPELFGLILKEINKAGEQDDPIAIEKRLALAFSKGALRLIRLYNLSEKNLIAIGFKKYLDLRQNTLMDKAIDLRIDTLTLYECNAQGMTITKRIIEVSQDVYAKSNHRKCFSTTKKIVLPPEIYNRLEELANRIAQGNKNWTPEDIELQSNNPEALEWFLKKIQKNELV